MTQKSSVRTTLGLLAGIPVAVAFVALTQGVETLHDKLRSSGPGTGSFLLDAVVQTPELRELLKDTSFISEILDTLRDGRQFDFRPIGWLGFADDPEDTHLVVSGSFGEFGLAPREALGLGLALVVLACALCDKERSRGGQS